MDDGQEHSCIDENAALDFAQGRLPGPEVRRIDVHADGCARCRLLVDEAVRAFRERATQDGTARVETTTMFRPGDEVADRYRIIRFIARGGMGEVYEAEDRILNARIAMKTVNATISDDPAATRLLKQEVSLARRITHENICRIYDVGVHVLSNRGPSHRVLFLTMELISGTSLGERLRSGGPLAPREARPILQAMIAGIGAAHRAGIVHRDLKTDNVMLADAGGATRVVVMDFGLARMASTRADAGTVPSSLDLPLTGTLPYMAPEQLEGRPTSAATDIYALGIVMFEVLSGQLPFRRDPLFGALQRLQQPAPPLREAAPGIDPAWESLVARCLERDPQRRPVSMDEIARSVPADRGDGEDLAPAVAVPASPRRRKPVIGGLVTGALILAVALAGRALVHRQAISAAPLDRAPSVHSQEGPAQRAPVGAEGAPAKAAEKAGPSVGGKKVLTTGTDNGLTAPLPDGAAAKDLAAHVGRSNHLKRMKADHGPGATTGRPRARIPAELTPVEAPGSDESGREVAAPPHTRSTDPIEGFSWDK